MIRPRGPDQASGPRTRPGIAPAVLHEFEHGSEPARRGQRTALGWALGLSLALLLIEMAGGIAFGSLALLADAAHLVADVTALVVALGSLILMARPASTHHSFGLARAEVLSAQVNALILLVAGGWILLEGVTRFRHPVPVDGAGLVAVATVGLLVNLVSALLVRRVAAQSLNMRASFLHLLTDGVGSLGAITAGLLILNRSWLRADSLVSMVTAVLVLGAAWRLLHETTHVLMEGTPRGVDLERVRAAMLEIDGVADVHHLHVWNLASDVPALSAHVVVTGDPTLRDSQRISRQVRATLNDRFAFTHMTIELEPTPDTETEPARGS